MTTEINPQAAAPAPKNGKRRKALLILATIVAIAAIVWTFYYFLVARWHEDTDDAYVQGNVVSITPQTIGTVVSATQATTASAVVRPMTSPSKPNSSGPVAPATEPPV